MANEKEAGYLNMDNVSEEQLSVWEKKYGKLKEIRIGRKVEDIEGKEVVVDEGKVCYLRKIDRATIKYAMSKSIKADMSIDSITPGEIVLKKCALGGNPEIMDDDKYYFRACMDANNYLNEVTGFL